MIGILLSTIELDRPRGDIGHPDTLPFPALFETANRTEDLLPLARSLKNRGAKAIITEHNSDPERFSELSIPVYTTPLTLLPLLVQATPGKIALLCDKESEVTPKIPFPIPRLIIAGMEDMPAFTEAYVTGTRPLDPEAVAFEIKFVTQRIKKTHPDLGTIVLMSPYMSAYRKAVKDAADIPIFDLVAFATFIHSAFS